VLVLADIIDFGSIFQFGQQTYGRRAIRWPRHQFTSTSGIPWLADSLAE
jgi:hypothetical protein